MLITDTTQCLLCRRVRRGGAGAPALSAVQATASATQAPPAATQAPPAAAAT